MCLLKTFYHVLFLIIVLFLFHGLSPAPFLWVRGCGSSIVLYIDLISTFWSYWQSPQPPFSSLTGWWDSGKSHIKRISINYCVNRSKTKLVEQDILSKLAAHLKVHFDSGRLSFLPFYLSTLSRLRALDLKVARGAQVHAPSRWVEEGESSSAYFFWLEKKKGTDRNISALRASDGTLVTDDDVLCGVFRSFYLDIFSAAPCDSNARAEQYFFCSSFSL